MDASRTLSDSLLVAASRELKGKARRVFVAKVCQSLCGGSSRKAEARFGWGRAMVAIGLEELDPELKTERQYTNLSAREVQAELIKRGYAAENVFKNDNDYPTGVIVPNQEMMQLNKPLQRSDSLRKYDILS